MTLLFGRNYLSGFLVVGLDGGCVGVCSLRVDIGVLLGVLVVFEVGGGDLEGVEEESGAAWVDVVLGEAGDDLAEGFLDGGSAAGLGEREGTAAGLAEAWVGDGLALGVVVVAELFSAQGGRAAAATLGESVAALVATKGVVAVLDLLDELVGFHGLSRRKVCKVFETETLGWYFVWC
jgi:hypothetical protein